jgi:hypothetical protein
MEHGAARPCKLILIHEDLDGGLLRFKRRAVVTVMVKRRDFDYVM